MRPVETGICPEQTETNAPHSSSMIGSRPRRETRLSPILDGREFVVTIGTPSLLGERFQGVV